MTEELKETLKIKTCRWCSLWVPRGMFCTQEDAGLKGRVNGQRTGPVIPLNRQPDESCSCWREWKPIKTTAGLDREERLHAQD